MRVEKDSEKAGLKLSIQKTKIMAPGPITSWQIDGQRVETGADFIFGWAPKSLQMVTTAKKLKYVTVSIISSSICHEVMGPDAMILSFLNVEF